VRAAEFVSLAELLAPPPQAKEAVSPPAEAQPTPEPPAAQVPPLPAEIVTAIREARLFRARLYDALNDARELLLTALAADVLGRELRSAPCDLDALLQRRAAQVPVVRVRVAPEDVDCVHALPVVVDAALRQGDAVVELAGGAIDARLGVRLAAVLEALR
jgi:flagellar biosynthesis/type III secretory pathway protein FliH